MRNGLVLAGALALALPYAVQAGDTEDFASCDGMRKPGRDDDGMRGVASSSDMRGINRERAPARVIANCTSVLEGDRIRSHQTLRRAHVLRARAAAYLQTGQPELALADLAAARAQVADRHDDPFFQRSMGLSFDLLEAIAMALTGDTERAATLASNAASARPFALQVQLASDVVLRQVAPTAQTSQSLMQISPTARQQAIPRLLTALRFAEAVDWGEREGLFASQPDPEVPVAALIGNRQAEQALVRSLSGLTIRADLAYALAATGDVERAQALVDGLRALQSPPEGGSTGVSVLPLLLRSAVIDRRIAMAEARTAIARGEYEPAAELVSRIRADDGPLIAELHDALAALRPEEIAPEPATATGLAEAEAAAVPEEPAAPSQIASVAIADPARDMGALRLLAFQLQFPPETTRSVIDYERSRPNILGALVGGALTLGTSLLGGIERTAGFRSTDNEDGTVTVEFTGNTLSAPMVEEMTLLRAAELAGAAQMPYFEVVGREDYMRYLVQTQYNVEINRTATGYKTELVIRFHDDPQASPFMLEAVDVIDHLGPLYYEQG